jgi:hypothetical protein
MPQHEWDCSHRFAPSPLENTGARLILFVPPDQGPRQLFP